MGFSRRLFVGGLPAVVLGRTAALEEGRPVGPSAVGTDLDAAGANVAGAGQAAHERFMMSAIEQARRNPAYPFGAVIVRTFTGEVLARGVNSSAEHPVLHGEVVAMTDYVRRHGNRGWSETTLYTTGEPCPICASAAVWAGVRRVVWGSSIEEIERTGIGQIGLPLREVVSRARAFYTPDLLLGGVLRGRTNRLFREAQRLRLCS
ncbi:nucleoside deaminase [Streptomyces chrestomyceticus]|uniref:nucleoside deaminase n=1 Tax=Streptomyces chrestomyceticus TaxID=68185 RepID=UPI0037944FDE